MLAIVYQLSYDSMVHHLVFHGLHPCFCLFNGWIPQKEIRSLSTTKAKPSFNQLFPIWKYLQVIPDVPYLHPISSHEKKNPPPFFWGTSDTPPGGHVVAPKFPPRGDQALQFLPLRDPTPRDPLALLPSLRLQRLWEVLPGESGPVKRKKPRDVAESLSVLQGYGVW